MRSFEKLYVKNYLAIRYIVEGIKNKLQKWSPFYPKSVAAYCLHCTEWTKIRFEMYF